MDIEVCSESGLHLPDKTRIKIHSIENGACTYTEKLHISSDYVFVSPCMYVHVNS